jgi:hypothetical protein
MILQQTDNFIKSCMKAWLLCQSCIHTETLRAKPRQALIAKCRVCSSSCFAVVGRLISNADDIQVYAFRCLLDCRECFDECEKYANIEDIEYCGHVCMDCAYILKKLVVVSNLN